MDSSEIPARRHRSDRSKPKHHRTGPTRHIPTHAQGSRQVSPGSGKLWPTAFAKDDHSKEKLVQGWLDDIQASGSGFIAGNPPHYKASNSKPLHQPQSLSPAPWAPHGLPLPLSLSKGLGISRLMSQPRETRRNKRQRSLSDDSSFIAPKESADNHRTQRSRSGLAARDEYYERGNTKRQPGSGPEESGSSPAPSSPDHNFEKRPRHKTRSDRYDTVKDHDSGKEKKRKKKKKIDHLASSREVMDNFNSHSILSDRITVSTVLSANCIR